MDERAANRALEPARSALEVGMYGLVNNAIRSMVLDQAGQATWDEIRGRAGVSQQDFRAMESYDDALTYGLVGAASELLETPAEDLLRAFGRHWILFTGRQGYGRLLELSGSSMAEFLGNLDAMHANLMLSFPDLDPPSFESEVREDGSIVLRYYSERPGLAPMVEGLIEGLGEYWNEPVTIQHVARKDGAGYDSFEISSTKAKQGLSDAA